MGAITNSGRLAALAHGLENQAAHLEAAGVPDFGSAQLDDVASVNDLAAAIRRGGARVGRGLRYAGALRRAPACDDTVSSSVVAMWHGRQVQRNLLI